MQVVKLYFLVVHTTVQKRAPLVALPDVLTSFSGKLPDWVRMAQKASDSLLRQG